MDERLQFVARRLGGESMAELCREFGISRKTGYKIFDRYQECGVQRVVRQCRVFRPTNDVMQLAKFKVHLEGGPEESLPTRGGLSRWAQMLSGSQLLLINDRRSDTGPTRRRVSGRAVVAVVQTAQAIMGKRATRAPAASSAPRRSLSQPKMRAVFVMVGDVLRKQPLQVPPVESNHMVEQLAAAASHPTLGNTILPGTYERGPHGIYFHGSKGRRNSVPYFASRSWIRNLGAAPTEMPPATAG
jgi:hypothetical protein